MLQKESNFYKNYKNICIEDFKDIDLKWVKEIDELEELLYQSNVSEITKNLIKDILDFRNEFNIKWNSISWTVWKILKYHKESENKYNFSIVDKFPILKEWNNLYQEKISDSLTWLKNKKYVEEKISELIEKKERDNKILFSVMILDIDFFKKINDTFWHQIWDSALIGITKILEDNFRKSDTISRWWWEEFLIILEDTNNESAFLKAERIRKNIENELITFIKNNDNKDIFCKMHETWSCINSHNCKNWNWKCFKNTITTSIWISTIRSNNWKVESKTTLIKRADLALYEAKRLWRNKVVNWIDY